MAYTFDGDAKTITLSAGTNTLVMRDCYSRSKDWLLDNAWSTQPLVATGGNLVKPGLYAGDYYYLQPGWIFVPQDADHVLDVVGNLIPSVTGAPLFAPRPGRTIQIPSTVSSLTQTVAVGSGVLPADVAAIAEATRGAILSDGVSFPGARVDAAISSVVGLTPAQSAALAQIQTRATELWQRWGLDPTKPLVVNADQPNGSITVGDIVLALLTSGKTTTVTRGA